MAIAVQGVTRVPGFVLKLGEPRCYLSWWDVLEIPLAPGSNVNRGLIGQSNSCEELALVKRVIGEDGSVGEA